MRRLFMMCTKEREVCRYELRDTGKSNKQHSKQKSFEWERQKCDFKAAIVAHNTRLPKEF